MEKIWFVILVSILLQVYCFKACFAMTSTNLATDQVALLALKSHITPDSSSVLAYNWSTATSCCNWIGVTCGHRYQRVTGLNLASMRLSGTIPPHIGNLSFLASLNIRNNSFSGSIPSSIYNMSLLQFLDLTDNSLSDSLPADMCNHLPELQNLLLHSNQLYGQIPSTLHKCRRLRILSLSHNNFTGSIPTEIGNLTMLTELSLAFNILQGEIPKEVRNLQHLEIFNLARNNLKGSIPSAIFNISSLVRVNVGTNSLSGSLPFDMCDRLPALRELSADRNNIIGSIPQGIGNCTSLVRVALGPNNLTGAIPHELVNLRNLEFLSLQLNGLTGAISPGLFNISTLETLSLASNSLSGQLPPRIDLGLPNLKKMYLWGNKLSGLIPISISNASKLTSLDLGHNLFSGFVPNTLGNLRLLEMLSIEDNSLTITEESSTPAAELMFLTSLTNCLNLRLLILSGNPLNGILPTSIGNLSDSLESFYANDCNIKGHIPREIGNLSNVILINLASNQLIGTIPPTVGRLQKLQGLEVFENKLQGSMPYDLCLLRNLAYLHLNANELSGEILACLGNLTSLLALYLDSNKLISTIPSTLSTLTRILKLNLSSNYLSGNLPLNIGSLKVVTVIDVSKNLLTGTIPSTIGSLQNLRNLSLAHNEFQGPIPPSFEGLVSLELLDLSHNNLSGVIPKSLEKLVYLRSLDVSSNMINGEIPNGGPFANFSAQSFMMNDALCGAPRFQVPRCKTGSPRGSTKTIVLVLKYGLPSIVIIVIVLLFVLIGCQKKKNERVPTQTELLPIAMRRISYQEILQATDGFNKCNLLGNGSFGSVYKGVLSDGFTIAVKVFNLQQKGAFKSFDVECEVLRNIRHRNLIKIISSCSTNLDFKALVLDYMPNESLEKWLYANNSHLDLLQRLNIMTDVALALEYLHHDYSTPIVHCDLKPSNILLDGDMVAHVGDFGIAKLLGDGEFMKQTITLATIGYMAPEYGTEGIVSTKGDVFSYGIMLMETFTGKKPTDDTFTEEMDLKRWVSDSLHGSITNDLNSNLLRREEEHFLAKQQCLSSVLSLAIECTADSPKDRINMKNVVKGLEKIKGILLAQNGRADLLGCKV